MNQQYRTTEGIAEIETDTDSPVAILDPVADETPIVDVAAVPEAQVGDTLVPEAEVRPNAGSLTALLERQESDRYRTRWNEIQGKFVDEPRDAVQQADALVTEVIGQITRMLADEHSSLEGRWKEGKDASTEDLRQALQHYRSFFNRLVV